MNDQHNNQSRGYFSYSYVLLEFVLELEIRSKNQSSDISKTERREVS